MKGLFGIFFTKEYKNFDSNYLEFRKQMLKSIQMFMSVFLISIMIIMYTTQSVPIHHYISLPVLLIGNNLITWLLVKFKKMEKLISAYIFLLQLTVPILTLELGFAFISTLEGASPMRLLVVGLQIGLAYAFAFLMLLPSPLKFLMTICFVFHILLRQQKSGEIVLGPSMVIIFLFLTLNYAYFKNEMLNLSVWLTLVRKNEGLKQYEKIIQHFPSQILITNKNSLEKDSALYINNDAEKLKEDIFQSMNAPGIRGFLQSFIIVDYLNEVSGGLSSSFPENLLSAIDEVCLEEDDDLINFFHTFIVIQAYSIKTNSSSQDSFCPKWEVKVGKIDWEQKKAHILIFNDISKAEKIRELKALDENKDKLIATVSHELRTPMNGIIGMIDVAIEELNRNSRCVNKYLDIAKSSAKTLLFLINDLLDMSLIRRGNLRLSLEWTELSEIIERLDPLIKIQTNSKNLEFQLENLCPKGTFVWADPLRLQQILINLLGNACKFTISGYVKLSLCLCQNITYPSWKPLSQRSSLKLGEISMTKKSECHSATKQSAGEDEFLIKNKKNEAVELVKLCVEDTGRGIKDENKAYLFQSFGKIETEGNSNGLGLGLSISQSLAKEMHPRGIKVKSVFGEGSKFTFFLKASSSFQENNLNIPEEPFSTRKLKEFECFKKKTLFIKTPLLQPTVKRVLVVDDDKTNQLVIDLYLKALNFEVESDKAYNGKEALDLVESNAKKGIFYNLILMDCDMPVMNGIEATKHIKNMMLSGCLPKVMIVALTANASLENQNSCLESGMSDIWAKPITRQDFITKMGKLNL